MTYYFSGSSSLSCVWPVSLKNLWLEQHGKKPMMRLLHEILYSFTYIEKLCFIDSLDFIKENWFDQQFGNLFVDRLVTLIISLETFDSIDQFYPLDQFDPLILVFWVDFTFAKFVLFHATSTGWFAFMIIFCSFAQR